MKQYELSDRRNRGVLLGRTVQTAREAAGLSQAELARCIERNAAYISRLEQGKFGRPQPEVLLSLAANLPLSLSDLWAAADYPFPDSLPGLDGYLHAVHPEWPVEAIERLVDYYEFLNEKYSLH